MSFTKQWTERPRESERCRSRQVHADHPAGDRSISGEDRICNWRPSTPEHMTYTCYGTLNTISSVCSVKVAVFHRLLLSVNLARANQALAQQNFGRSPIRLQNGSKYHLYLPPDMILPPGLRIDC